MGESGRPATALEVSVSFGRFEHDDSLSWEKWSSFSPNKYLEEVGKYSTPGSVAQKKAYFEAHYKKIAAQKAEQSDQEKQIASPTTPTRDESEKKSHVKLTYVGDEEIEVSSNGRSGEDLDLEEAEIESPDESSQIKHKTVKDGEFNVLSNGRNTEENLEQETVDLTSFKVGKEDISIIEDREECSEKLNDASNYIESIDKEELIEKEADFIFIPKEETANVQMSHEISQGSIVEPSSKDVEEANGTLVKKNKIMKTPPARDIARKISIPKKEPNPPETTKKKVASSSSTVKKSITSTKFSRESTPGLSKSTIMPKKPTKSSLQKSSFTSPGEHKRAIIPTTSLYMSMSLDKGKPLPSSAIANRKSLIMEQMGDKDIVKRAFKTFQKQLNNGVTTSSSNEKSNGQQQMSGTVSDQKVTRALNPRTENERLRRSVVKTNQRGGDFGNRSSNSPLVLHKGSGEERNKKPIFESPSTKLKSDAKLEKQKLKTSIHEPGKELRAAKTSMEKEANLKKSKQGLNFKACAATTLPYNRANIKTKIPSHKEDNVKNHHQPTPRR